MQRSWLVPFLIVFFLFALYQRGHSTEVRADHEVNCAVVRAKVTEHGKAIVVAWALSRGYGWQEIQRIRKRCGV